MESFLHLSSPVTPNWRLAARSLSVASEPSSPFLFSSLLEKNSENAET